MCLQTKADHLQPVVHERPVPCPLQSQIAGRQRITVGQKLPRHRPMMIRTAGACFRYLIRGIECARGTDGHLKRPITPREWEDPLQHTVFGLLAVARPTHVEKAAQRNLDSGQTAPQADWRNVKRGYTGGHCIRHCAVVNDPAAARRGLQKTGRADRDR